ncbi:MAG TPA: hypothetical protein VNX28_06165 [Gemmataceae bacterium]|jgi:hypothetical protein|nr:hypothetical protein [Gemmataceae bacterium]
MSKTALDSLVAAGLALALLVVLGVDRLLPTSTSTARLEQVAAEPSPLRVRKLRLAVSLTSKPKHDWDKMPGLLDHLGQGYQYTQVPVRDLYNPNTFDGFDVLFFTCSPEGNDQAVADNLRQFVARGGTLYASDWRFLAVAKAFPDMVNKGLIGEGADQKLEADVVDAGLQDALGTKHVSLRFDLPEWKTAAFGGERVKVLMKARYLVQPPEGSEPSQWAETPLLVKFGFDKGTVIFTSFHNEAQNSEVEKKLLKYLVFSAVTAQIENEANLTMLKGGFSPQKSNLFSASGQSAVSNVYKSKAPKVRFILGFQEQGARLKLMVIRPDGVQREMEGTSTIVLEDTCPTVGDWRYTVTALSVPFPDFPFTLTVGESP